MDCSMRCMPSGDCTGNFSWPVQKRLLSDPHVVPHRTIVALGCRIYTVRVAYTLSVLVSEHFAVWEGSEQLHTSGMGVPRDGDVAFVE
jgi:hypothetical protein